MDIHRVTKEHDLAKRAVGYGIPGVTIDGNDVFLVYETVKKAVERARKGEGPSIVECKTWRWQGHHVGDPATYRSAEKTEEWKAKEPIGNLEALNLLKEEEIKEIRDAIDAEIAEACKFAEDSPYADASEAYTDVFSE